MFPVTEEHLTASVRHRLSKTNESQNQMVNNPHNHHQAQQSSNASVRRVNKPK